jgi:omega-amidase
MNAHLVQMDMAWESPADNYITIRSLLAGSPLSPGDLVLLPEMCDTGFSFNISKTADTSGNTLLFFRELAATHNITVQGGRTITTGISSFNVMTVVAPGGDILCEYAKIHPFQREADAITPGTQIQTFNISDRAGDTLTLAPAICYDLRFPELFRLGLKAGAGVFTIGACWPTIRLHHWRALAIARAIENQSYVLAVNRVGKDPFTSYTGGSIAIGPRGDILGELADGQGVLTVPIAGAEVASWRAAFPAWKDMRLL